MAIDGCGFMAVERRGCVTHGIVGAAAVMVECVAIVRDVVMGTDVLLNSFGTVKGLRCCGDWAAVRRAIGVTDKLAYCCCGTAMVRDGGGVPIGTHDLDGTAVAERVSEGVVVVRGGSEADALIVRFCVGVGVMDLRGIMSAVVFFRVTPSGFVKSEIIVMVIKTKNKN